MFQTPEEREAMLRLSSLVESEVLAPMEAHGWKHGTPPPVSPTDNPGGNEPPPAATGNQPGPADNPPAAREPSTGESDALTPGVFDLESMKDPTTGLYFGKYKTTSDALKGIGNVVNMAKQAFTERDVARAALAEAQKQAAVPAVVPSSLPPSPAQQPVTKVKSEKLEAVLSKLVEEGGIIDSENLEALMDGIADQADKIASARLKETTQVDERWTEVDQYMAVKHPRASQFVEELGLFVQSDPLLASAVNALTEKEMLKEATELAWTTFEKTLPPESGPDPRALAETEKAEIAAQAREQARKEAVEAARRDAGVMTSSVGGVHEALETGPSEDEVAIAAARMRATGIGKDWRALTFGRELTGPLFDD